MRTTPTVQRWKTFQEGTTAKKGDNNNIVDKALEKFPIAVFKFREALCTKDTQPGKALVLKFLLRKKE